MATLPSTLLAHAKAQPDAPFLLSWIDTSSMDKAEAPVGGVVQTCTYAQLSDGMLLAAKWLRDALGLQEGEYVALYAPNSIGFVAFTLGTMARGGISVHLNWRNNVSVTEKLVAGMRPRTLMAGGGTFLTQAQSVAAKTGVRLDKLEMICTDYSICPLKPGAPLADTQELLATIATADPKKTAAVFFTGGTTGTPKAVPHSHNGLLWEAERCKEAMPPGIEAGTVCFTPFFHVMGFVANFVTNLNAGCRAFVLADPDAKLSAPLVLRAVKELKPAVLNTVPWVVEGLVEMMRSKTAAAGAGAEAAGVLAALKLVTYGGAALAPHCDDVLRHHGITVACTYGQTELAGPVMFGKPGGDPKLLRPARGMAYEVMTSDTLEAGTGELVLLQCGSATDGYLALEKGSPRSLTGGNGSLVPTQRYHTNDRFRKVVEEDGEWLEYVCRNDDLLVHTSGEMSNPLPWEGQMLAEAATIINAVCVVGTGMPRCWALVELQEGVSFESKDTQTILTAGVAAANGLQPDYSRILAQHVILLNKGVLPKTVKGTVQRGKVEIILKTMLEGVSNGEPMPPTLHSPKAAAAEAVHHKDLLSDVLRIIRQVCHISVDPDEPLMAAGVDSLSVGELIASLQELSVTDRPLPATMLFAHPTARLLAKALVTDPSAIKAAVRISHEAAAGGAAVLCGSSAQLPIGSSEYLADAVACGVDGITKVPAGRWAEVQPGGEISDVVASRMSYGGFIDGVELMDNKFFGIAPTEVSAMDPCQRLMLENGYAAFYASGSDKAALDGTLTGVFLGFAGTDFASILASGSDATSVYAATGATSAVACGRISYVLGFHGPCISYDTACSAALSATHGALRALQRNECIQGLAAGVGLILLSSVSQTFALAGMTSEKGHCHTFDAGADGYCRAEACSTVVLKMKAAMSEVDLLGAAIRQDGRSASLTAPSSVAQQGLIEAAVGDAGVTPKLLSVLEAHGTGTELGDPIEASSFAAVCAYDPTAQRTVGGVKANLGHGEPAAGMTGLLKLASGLTSELIAPNAQLRMLNPYVHDAIAGVNAALPTNAGKTIMDSKSAGGVSSFGYAGTIAHAILQKAAGKTPSTTALKPLKYKKRSFPWTVGGGAGAGAGEAAEEEEQYMNLEEVIELLIAELKDLVPPGAGPLTKDTRVGDLDLDSLAVGQLAGSVRKATSESFNVPKVSEGEVTITEVAEMVVKKIELSKEQNKDGKKRTNNGENALEASHHSTVALGTSEMWPNMIEDPCVFVFNSPRSGSTMFQLILNTHPKLWAPQELHLIMCSTVGEWRDLFLRTVYAEPLVGAIHELLQGQEGGEGKTIEEAREVLAAWPDSTSIREVYIYLQENCKPSLLVDKTPMNADHPNFIRRTLRGWTCPYIIHLYRHPVPAIKSIMDLRETVGMVQGFEKTANTDMDRFKVAEEVWLNANRNLVDILAKEAAPSQLATVCYEVLVTQPEETLRNLCSALSLEFEPQMLDPYEADSTKKFKAQSETVFVGDYKLFKRSAIDASQADKWAKTNLPAALRGATLGLAKELGYTNFPLQMPPELTWLKPPKKHTNGPPDEFILCVHPRTGMLEILRDLSTHLSTPCLGLQLSHRAVQGTTCVAHLEQRYWDLCTSKEVDLWRGGPKQKRMMIGHSFGCRITLSFAARFDEMGCKDVRVVLMDGRVAEQPMMTLRPDDVAGHKLEDTIRMLSGDQAANNMEMLRALPAEDEEGVWKALPRKQLSRHVRSIYIASEEPMGCERTQELVRDTEVQRIKGMHILAMQELSKGDEGKARLKRWDEFFTEKVAELDDTACSGSSMENSPIASRADPVVG